MRLVGSSLGAVIIALCPRIAFTQYGSVDAIETPLQQQISVKSVLNRIEECAGVLAEFLNTMIFGANGPNRALKPFLVPETHTGNVLKAFLPNGYQGRVFPSSAKAAKTFPLSTNPPSNLLFSLGCLRIFDFSVNGAMDQTPQCTFSPQPKQLLINGSLQLDRDGPLGFEIMYCIAAALGGEFEKISKVATADQVDKVMNARVTRWAGLSCCHVTDVWRYH